ncbi:MAG: PDZ domain-containing protein [Acidimicrobiaceae bacterium]|nr:PDZ domain-containing protein [Acidimicrobiaceae bacterium]
MNDTPYEDSDTTPVDANAHEALHGAVVPGELTPSETTPASSPEPQSADAPPSNVWNPQEHTVANVGAIEAPSSPVAPSDHLAPLAPGYVDEAPLSSQRRQTRSLWSNRLSLLLIAALVGGLAGHYASSSSNGGSVSVSTVSTAPGGAVLPSGMSIPSLVQKVSPSVVSIDVKGQGTEDQGTGMIISANGLVVTNNHVIAAAVGGGTITVTRTGSTKSLPATLIGTNPVDDVALIRINGASGLPAVTFGNSNALVVGDAVVAIGNALGLAAGTPTVTQGIVSALGRTVTAGTSNATETLNNMIQTDAAINPGNSGGPLLDSSGDVIGMNTAVAGTLPDGTSAQNIGFAIPVATIQSLLKKLAAGESVVNHGAFIGVEIMSMTPSLQAQYGFTVSTGAVVMSVIAGTGAASAGVKQGDVIVMINNTRIGGAQDVSSVISSLRPGDVISLHIVRGSKHLTLTVTLGTQPAG